MTIDDFPPEDSTATRPMWEPLDAELRHNGANGGLDRGRRAHLDNAAPNA